MRNKKIYKYCQETLYLSGLSHYMQLKTNAFSQFRETNLGASPRTNNNQLNLNNEYTISNQFPFKNWVPLENPQFENLFLKMV
jgi:hypothetical protein